VQTFELNPYPVEDVPEIEIVGTVERIGNQLSLCYEVRGDVGSILLHPPSTPARKDDLWMATCFEFFLAVPGTLGYWEFNMSPAGDWNVYRMDEYRRVGFREESAIRKLPFRFQKEKTELSLDIVMDLSPIIQPEEKIEIGISAVIQTMDKKETHWALSHPNEWASQPDFHLRESFVLEF
jgi:hypothetical protein